jgi:hypothetical protein
MRELLLWQRLVILLLVLLNLIVIALGILIFMGRLSG